MANATTAFSQGLDSRNFDNLFLKVARNFAISELAKSDPEFEESFNRDSAKAINENRTALLDIINNFRIRGLASQEMVEYCTA